MNLNEILKLTLIPLSKFILLICNITNFLEVISKYLFFVAAFFFQHSDLLCAILILENI